MNFDKVDFANSLRTVGWNTAAVQGFEQDAYGATLLLIHFIDHLTPAGRLAWARSNNMASDVGQRGIQKTKEGFFLGWLNQLRLGVYGTAFDNESVTKQPSRVSSPWSLNDAEFTYCMLYIKTGRAPDPAKFEKRFLSANAQMIAGKVEDTLKKKALEYLQKGAIAVGGAAVETFFKIKGSTVGGLVLDVGWNLLSDQLAKVQLADLTARYAIDETRRMYLVPKGLSAYQQISGL
jgi:hypothetical protein